MHVRCGASGRRQQSEWSFEGPWTSSSGHGPTRSPRVIDSTIHTLEEDTPVDVSECGLEILEVEGDRATVTFEGESTDMVGIDGRWFLSLPEEQEEGP